MNKTIHQNYIEMNLENQELLQYILKPGHNIECKEGVLWVTRPGDLCDYLLRPGERYVSQAAGKVAISALGKAVFTISNN